MNTKLVSPIGGVLALAVLLAGCGDSSEDAAGGPSRSQPPPAATEEVQERHNDADTEFAQMMIVHHEGAIEMADLAVEKAASGEVRTLAEGISAAQGPEIEQMTSWLETWGEETRPMEGHGDHAGMDMEGMSQEEAMTGLEGLSGTEFDRRFLELMIAHHEGAVQMAEMQLQDGENRQALDLAQQVIEDQQAEIARMEQLLENL